MQSPAEEPNRAEKGILSYILENCVFAYDELCQVNRDLINGMSPSSAADVNHLGAMNRMIQDYLIVRVAGLFDRTKGVVSLDKLFSGDAKYQAVKMNEVIQYIIQQRNNFVAHTNKSHIQNNFPVTERICKSNVRVLLVNFQALVKN